MRSRILSRPAAVSYSVAATRRLGLRWCVVGVSVVALWAAALPAVAAPSRPKKKPAPEVELYNDAYRAIRDLEFAQAQGLLERALGLNEAFPEAHNNLAYTLRKQGEDHFEAALEHYDRAIELDPELEEAYMYRGVLYVQVGDLSAARGDHAVLKDLDKKLARELEWVIENGREKEPERFFGVTKKR